MFDFLSLSESGCQAHHFETVNRYKKYRVSFSTMMSGGSIVKIRQKVKQECGHEGCSERRETWKKVGSMRKRGKFDEFDVTPDMLEDMAEE